MRPPPTSSLSCPRPKETPWAFDVGPCGRIWTSEHVFLAAPLPHVRPVSLMAPSPTCGPPPPCEAPLPHVLPTPGISSGLRVVRTGEARGPLRPRVALPAP